MGDLFSMLTNALPFISDPVGFPWIVNFPSLLPSTSQPNNKKTDSSTLPSHATIPGMDFNTLKKTIQSHTHVIDVTVHPAPGSKLTQEDLDKIAKEILKETENTPNDQIVAQKLKTAIQQKAPGSDITIKIIAPKNNTRENENDLLIYAIIGLIVVAIVIALFY